MTARINSRAGRPRAAAERRGDGAVAVGATANIDQVTGRLARGEGTAGKLLTDQQLYDRLNSMAGAVRRGGRGLAAGRGTAGQLLRDQQLYENMNRAVTELRDLLADIRKDPEEVSSRERQHLLATGGNHGIERQFRQAAYSWRLFSARSPGPPWRCLYAPASGEETRRKLAEKAREGRDRAEEFAREGREFVNRQRDNIVSAVERGREAFEQARKETL